MILLRVLVMMYARVQDDHAKMDPLAMGRLLELRY